MKEMLAPNFISSLMESLSHSKEMTIKSFVAISKEMRLDN